MIVDNGYLKVTLGPHTNVFGNENNFIVMFTDKDKTMSVVMPPRYLVELLRTMAGYADFLESRTDK